MYPDIGVRSQMAWWWAWMCSHSSVKLYFSGQRREPGVSGKNRQQTGVDGLLKRSFLIPQHCAWSRATFITEEVEAQLHVASFNYAPWRGRVWSQLWSVLIDAFLFYISYLGVEDSEFQAIMYNNQICIFWKNLSCSDVVYKLSGIED